VGTGNSATFYGETERSVIIIFYILKEFSFPQSLEAEIKIPLNFLIFPLMKRILSFLLVFLSGTILLFSQQTDAGKYLLKKANENRDLPNTNPEKVFQEAKKIEKEAKKTNGEEKEIKAIAVQCDYYRKKNDFENLLDKANLLLQKASSNNDYIHTAFAHIFLFEVYSVNNLYPKALKELDLAESAVKKANQNDNFTIIVKSIVYINYANYYATQEKEREKQIRYLKLSGIEIDKMPDEELRRKYRYANYSNQALAYSEDKQTDSAEYYVNLSISKERDYDRDDNIRFANFKILGIIAKEKKDYDKAIYYFLEAEKLKEYQNHSNISDLYEDLIEVYENSNESEKADEYKMRRDSLKLSVSENKNKTLQNLLTANENYAKKQLIYLSAFLFILIIVFVFFTIRKKRIIRYQEETSRNYLNEFMEKKPDTDYSMLLDLLEEKDPAFMNYFDKSFPNFSKKLTEINPQIIQSEIEFCALLKLKIPTKDIARYRYITPKTVQNKKYLIRKKLNIPQNIDIYQWFDVS